MANKYEQKAEIEIDLHGHTTAESKEILDALLKEKKYSIVRIIVGKGTHSVGGAVLPNFVRSYLHSHGIRYKQSKISNGGE